METGLPSALEAWVAEVGGGRLSRRERALARREAWAVDVTRPDGSVLEAFLRLAHEGDPANSAAALRKETTVVKALHGTGLPVPAVLADDHTLAATLFERVPGRTDLHRCPPEQQDAVYRHYLEVLGALHQLPVDSLDVGLPVPGSPHACAMAEVEAIGAACPPPWGPLATFGITWLDRRAPTEVARVSLLHGDAGIANFLFVDDRVTAAIDWEWAHFGDPMEDLGNLNIHASFSPSGDWPSLLPHYERASGIPVDVDKILYYRVSNMVRSVLALAPITARLDARDPVALNLCFKIICDRLLCEAIAEASGVELERPEVPDPGPETTLHGVVADDLEASVASEVTGDFAHDRLANAVLLVRTLDRRQQLGPWADAADVAELAELLGHRPRDVDAGLAELDAALPSWGPERDADVLRFLARRAYRIEAVAAPVVSLFGDTRLRPVR